MRYLTATRPVVYLAGLRDKQGTVRNPPPAVVRGDAQLTRRLINQLHGRKHRYVSGVLSFRELISPADEQLIIDRFEAAAFAGLEPGQFDCLWVRHAHNRRTELHFLLPRCELLSGKALNIRPPGKRSEELFDTFRKLINRDFHLKDPDRSVARLSAAEIDGLREKLRRLTTARARYNRTRFPGPAAALPTPYPIEPYEDRTRSADRNATPPGAGTHHPQRDSGGALERLGNATGAMGAAAEQVAYAGVRLDRAFGAFRRTTPALTVPTAAGHYARRDSAASADAQSEWDEEMELILGLAVGIGFGGIG